MRYPSLLFLFCITLLNSLISHGADIDGLKLHLDASQVNSLSLNENVVKEWRDVSNDNIVFFAEAGAPLYEPNAANGLGAIYFDGSSYFATLSHDALNLSNEVGGITAFAVAKNDAYEHQCLIRIGRGYGDTAAGLRFMLGRSTYQHRVVARRVDSGNYATLHTGAGTVLPEHWVIDNAWVDYENGRAGIYINDVLMNTSEDFLDKGKTSYTNSQMFRIGNDHSDQFWQGYIAEILVFDRVLTDNEINQVQHYLAEKYGISLSR